MRVVLATTFLFSACGDSGDTANALVAETAKALPAGANPLALKQGRGSSFAFRYYRVADGTVDGVAAATSATLTNQKTGVETAETDCVAPLIGTTNNPSGDVPCPPGTHAKVLRLDRNRPPYGYEVMIRFFPDGPGVIVDVSAATLG